MISPMVRWMSRAWSFTMLSAVLFTTGCGGGYPEPSSPADYTSGDDPALAVQQDPMYEPAVATDNAALMTADYQDTDPAALTEFKADLDPYGVWINDPAYGMVWVPNSTIVGTDFAPYVSGGHWAMSAQGDWLWESDYPFGWVTFHYGRWVWVPNTGWAWIAGRRYANSWVVWRTSYDNYGYVGWAPMPPYYYWSGGVAVSFWVVPPTPYVFCRSSYVFSPQMHSHMAAGPQVREAAAHTRPYAPANPSIGSSNGGHRFASPTRGPTLAEAGVPKDAAPKGFSSPNARALGAAHPPSAAEASRHSMVHAASAGLSGGSGSTSRSLAVSRPVYHGMPSRGPSYAPGGPGPAYRSAGSPPGYRSSPAPYYGPSAAHPSSIPGYRPPSYSNPSYSGPSYHAPSPSYGVSPSFHAPSSSHSPSYRSGGSPSFHAPAPTTTYRPSTSGSTFHAPSGGSRSFGGGHSHGGGGGRRH